MPITKRAKVGGFSWSDFGKEGYKAQAFNGTAEQRLKATPGICIHGTHWSAECRECGIWRVYPRSDDTVKVPSESGRRTDVGNGARFASREGSKNDGGSWFSIAHNTVSGHGQNPDDRKTSGLVNIRNGHSHTRHLTNQAEHDAVKNGGDWFGAGDDCSLQRRAGSKSTARKAASAHIAKIPFELARHIARCWHP